MFYKNAIVKSFVKFRGKNLHVGPVHKVEDLHKPVTFLKRTTKRTPSHLGLHFLWVLLIFLGLANEWQEQFVTVAVVSKSYWNRLQKS